MENHVVQGEENFMDDRIYNDLLEYIRDLEERTKLVELAILSGEGGHLMGKPVKIQTEWPEGVPNGFKDEEQLRKWAKKKLNEATGQEKVNQEVKMTARVEHP